MVRAMYKAIIEYSDKKKEWEATIWYKPGSVMCQGFKNIEEAIEFVRNNIALEAVTNTKK